MTGMEFAAAGLVILAVGLMFLSVEHRLRRMERRLRQVERRVDGGIDPRGVSTDHGALQEIDRLLERGEKIQAIKLYREVTGAGLAEAKDAVERRTAGRR
jgi:ribosomal protein L7/L12